MDYVIRPLVAEDESILWEMLYHGLSSLAEQERPSREIVHRPEFSRYVAGWGRAGDTGFVAHDKKDGSLLGAVWLRRPIGKTHAAATGSCRETGAPRAWHRYGAANAIGSRESRAVNNLAQVHSRQTCVAALRAIRIQNRRREARRGRNA